MTVWVWDIAFWFAVVVGVVALYYIISFGLAMYALSDVLGWRRKGRRR